MQSIGPLPASNMMLINLPDMVSITMKWDIVFPQELFQALHERITVWCIVHRDLPDLRISQHAVFQGNNVAYLEQYAILFQNFEKNVAKMFTGVITFDKPERDHTRRLNNFTISISFHKMGCDSLKAIKVWIALHVSCQGDMSKRILYCAN